MNQQLSIVRLDGGGRSGPYIPFILRWIISSQQQPVMRWLLGSEEAVRILTEEWLKRQTSQLWSGRASLTMINGEPFGGFIGLPAAVQQLCFRADMVALLSGVSIDRRAAYATKIREAYFTFPPLAPNAYVLSQLGIGPEFRGRGLGHYVIDSFLNQGRAEGFRQFQLNVLADNKPAVQLYASAGFVVEREFLAGAGQFQYFCMVSKC
jgi:ribosomal protein S18 acetylase RimI-like enzyme